MFGLIRMQLALLPFLWAAFTEGDPPAGDPPANPPADPPRFTQADLDRIVKQRLDDEKKRRDEEAEKERKAAEVEKAKRDGELERAAALEKERADAAERERDEERQRARDRIARAEVKATAVGLGFANPDLAYRLIDATALVFDEDGAVTNAEVLLKELATAEPYLIKSDKPKPNGTGPTPNPADPTPLTREQRIQKVLDQAGVRR